ncbi:MULTISPECIES: HEAT repeat domain-containing protein [unclassified Streptomyces]|uniref:HEAT repeat domain-containing protein n=1 Tax=unclassified Streptomyces TaxID=2593676 RepID=UPI0033A90232
MTAARRDVDARLVMAVTAKDLSAVQACLADGADPDILGPDGLPLLCAAVAGFDHEIAEALVEAGADSDRELPDGTTPLLRAVDHGSPVMVEAVLGKDPRLRIAESTLQRLLDLARHWFETGATEELRRRTGATGQAVQRVITDDGHTYVEEVSLGGLTVRAGHAAVLTSLERAFGVQPSVAEVVARAVPHPDETHVNWSTAGYVLAYRRSPEAWSALADLRHHPDPVHRRFLASVLWNRDYLANIHQRQDTEQDADLLAAWALEEPDGHVLAKVLDVYTGKDHPGKEAVGLRYAGHEDPRVRSELPYCLNLRQVLGNEQVLTTLLALAGDRDPGVRAAVAQSFGSPRDLVPVIRDRLLTLLRDPHPDVRAAAAASLSTSHDRAAPVTEALAALLDEEDQALRLEAAYALALRDDPRTEEAYERVGPLRPDLRDDHRASEHWRYRWRNRPDDATSP